MSRFRRNGLMLVTLLLLVVLGGAVWLMPKPATDVGPGGTAVLRRLLEARGVEVRRGPRPGPGDGTFFLPYDLRGRSESAAVLEWVRAGGRAVVADPASRVLRGAGIGRTDGGVGGLDPSQELRGDCLPAAAAGVRGIVASSTDATLVTSGPEPVGCFRRGDGWFLVERSLGSGTVVGLGGLTPLTNEHLDDADDVVLAWSLLGDAGPVTVGDPVAGPAPPSRGIWSALPAPARLVILQLVLAALLLVLARGRRLGPPDDERLPAPIPGSELIDATGELYRGSRAAAHAADLLRGRFRDRAGRRLGHPGRAGDLPEAVAVATGEDPGAVASLLARPVAGEEDLVGVAMGVERLERRLEGAG